MMTHPTRGRGFRTSRYVPFLLITVLLLMFLVNISFWMPKGTTDSTTAPQDNSNNNAGTKNSNNNADNGNSEYNSNSNSNSNSGSSTNRGKPMISAILLNWKRPDNTKRLAQHLVKYPFVKEVLVWNNNYNESMNEIDLDTRKKVQVFNSPSNLYFLARYVACAYATTDICFFQDDDWYVWPLKSMYHNYLRFPHMLHTDTNAFVHFLAWEWTFYNEKVSMHTGFNWLGTGALVSKANVIKFFKQLEMYKIPGDTTIYADMLFSTWLNSPPYQLSNNLIELDQSFAFSGQPGGIARNKKYMYYGAKFMFEQMQQRSPYFDTEEAKPTFEQRDVRSPCSNDMCLFLTNVNSFPSPRDYVYLPAMNIDDVEAAHVKDFNHEKYTTNPYHAAVDADDVSSWKSVREVQKGDFFGLDIFEEGTPKRNIFLHVRHNLQENLVVQISDDATNWATLNDFKVLATEDKTRYQYQLSALTPEYRFIRFLCNNSNSNNNKACPSFFEVADISNFDKFYVWDNNPNSNSNSNKHMQHDKPAI